MGLRLNALSPIAVLLGWLNLQPATDNEQWHNWSLDVILQRFTHCCEQLMPQLVGYQIHAVSVTTFGVDGALVDERGELLDPIISWKCPRTVKIMSDIARYISPDELQRLSGVGHFNFNTLYKLVWLKENRLMIWEQAYAWLFISSLINHRFTGKFTTDRTMAGTSSKRHSATLSYAVLASRMSCFCQ